MSKKKKRYCKYKYKYLYKIVNKIIKSNLIDSKKVEFIEKIISGELISW